MICMRAAILFALTRAGLPKQLSVLAAILDAWFYFYRCAGVSRRHITIATITAPRYETSKNKQDAV